MYTKYPHRKIRHRITHLNNREIAIVFGVFIGMFVGAYGIFFGHFASVPVLGAAVERGVAFKIGAVILSGGTFGNLLSYVGACIDVLTNHRTIFDLLGCRYKGFD